MMGPSWPHDTARLASKAIKAKNRLQFTNLASAKIISQLGVRSSLFACQSRLGDLAVSTAGLRRGLGRAAGCSGAAPALRLSQPRLKAFGSTGCSQGLLAPASPPVQRIRYGKHTATHSLREKYLGRVGSPHTDAVSRWSWPAAS